MHIAGALRDWRLMFDSDKVTTLAPRENMCEALLVQLQQSQDRHVFACFAGGNDLVSGSDSKFIALAQRNTFPEG